MAIRVTKNPLWIAALLIFGVLVPVFLSSYWSNSSTAPQIPETFEKQQSTEATHLSRVLRRDHGKWGSTHPRYRLLNALKGYLQYEESRLSDINTWANRYKKLPSKQHKYIEKTIGYANKLDTVASLMKQNAVTAKAILQNGLDFYGIGMPELEAFVEATRNETSRMLKGNALYAMKHIVRDWTQAGLHERQRTFPCMINAVQREFPTHSQSPGIRVLVPGAGLGRLAHEIASLGGFDVTTNEWCPSMNLAYRYLITLDTANSTEIHPYVDTWSHRATTSSLIRGFQYPDSLLSTSRSAVSLVEGDFTRVLKAYEGSFDAVVTLFFIDTATNILTYLETIHSMLKPGGVWINFGPMLYGSNPSVQFSLDEVLALAEGLGFVIEQPSDECGETMEFDPRLKGTYVPYSSDPQSLSRNAYLAQHWIARKRP